MMKIIIVLRDHNEQPLLTATFGDSGFWMEFIKDLIEIVLKSEEWEDRDILIRFEVE